MGTLLDVGLHFAGKSAHVLTQAHPWNIGYHVEMAKLGPPFQKGIQHLQGNILSQRIGAPLLRETASRRISLYCE